MIKKRTMKERTEKGSVNKMLNTFNNKIDDLEFEDFDESVDINEARDAHTWGITYRDKSNRTKQHMVGASDAYDAKMKARKELGINFSDIDDIELVEDFDEEDANICEAFKTYEDVLKAIKKTYGDSGVKAYELCLKLFEEETGINAHNLKGKLVFTTNSRGPVSAASVANTKPATYIKMIESGEISALKLLMKYYYNMVGDPTLSVNRLNEAVNSYDTIRERVEDYLYQMIGDRFEEWFMDITDNLSQTIYSKFKDYDPDWCNDESSANIDDFYNDVITNIVGYIADDLFTYYDE